MRVILSSEHLRAIEAHGASAYPDEGAGFLLGKQEGDMVAVRGLLPLDNKREAEARFNRYELAPQDFMRSEVEAARQGLDVVGVFHSHPDHPARPSAFDRDHALPNFTYLITAVAGGRPELTTAWRLNEDRADFAQDTIEIRESIHSTEKGD